MSKYRGSSRHSSQASSSDDAALALILQVLGPSDLKPEDDVHLSDILPPLTSSNEVDFELYAFIAIVINDNIKPWYSKITSDPAFIAEIVQIIAHCSRALEQRLRQVSLSTLIYNDLSAVLEAHIKIWRTAQQAVGDTGDYQQLHSAYHALRPHPALQPVPDLKNPQTMIQQQRNDTDYRRLISEGLLASLLPGEDLQNPCLFALVSEVLSDLILGTLLSSRVSDPVFIYECVAKAVEHARYQSGGARWLVDKTNAPQDRLEQYGLLSSNSQFKLGPKGWRQAASDLFWTAAQAVYNLVLGLQVTARILSQQKPRRRSQHDSRAARPTSEQQLERKAQAHPQSLDAFTAAVEPTARQPLPMLALRCWWLLGALLWIDVRMPWLCAIAMSLQQFLLRGPWRLAAFDNRIDR